MVSSFVIHTSIRVPSKYREEFNEFMEVFEGSMKCIEGEVPAYFDKGFCEGGEAVLESYFHGTFPKTTPIKNLHTNWRCNENGYLYDDCEKFHGSISTLHYCIQEFFAPRNIYLTGNIIGVNAEYPMVFAYRIEETEIILDEQVTRGFLKIYEELENIYYESNMDEDNIVENVVKLMCDRMDISL